MRLLSVSTAMSASSRWRTGSEGTPQERWPAGWRWTGYCEYFRRGERGRFLPGRNGFSIDTALLGDSVRSAGRAIYEAARSNLRWERMGTTLAAVLLRKNRLSIAHVGDSRVYLARAGILEQLTEDHSVKEKTMRHVLTR
ncbi:MAG: hypothetical protein U0411_14405, partial [Thermodesulfovibrionales bacterium]